MVTLQYSVQSRLESVGDLLKLIVVKGFLDEFCGGSDTERFGENLKK